MTTYIGNSGEVQIGANAVAEVLNFSVTETAPAVDDSVQGDTWRTHKMGLPSWSGSISCYYMEGDTTGQDAMTIGASVDLSLMPRGDTAGNLDLNGTASITSIESTTELDGIITVNFSFQGNGALAKDTIV